MAGKCTSNKLSLKKLNDYYVWLESNQGILDKRNQPVYRWESSLGCSSHIHTSDQRPAFFAAHLVSSHLLGSSRRAARATADQKPVPVSMRICRCSCICWLIFIKSAWKKVMKFTACLTHLSKWSITMVIVSPQFLGLFPFQNGLFMAYEWRLITNYLLNWGWSSKKRVRTRGVRYTILELKPKMFVFEAPP